MKRHFILWFVLMTSHYSFSQSIGLHTVTPIAPVSIQQPQGTTIDSYQPIVDIKNTSTQASHAIGIQSVSKPSAGYGIGGQFEGGALGGIFKSEYIGIRSECNRTFDDNYAAYFKGTGGAASQTVHGLRAESSGPNGSLYGVSGYAVGNGNFFSVGVKGEASGSASSNYGVMGSAIGATGKNWAGYFTYGDVYIQNKVGIGQQNPEFDLDISSEQSVIRMKSFVSTFGSVVELRNSIPNPTFLGAINFGDETSTDGQIAYHGNHNLTFRVNNAERLRINASGLTGIGRTPTTNKLEVEGNASKSTAGDWLANSDERLKKNIKPLEAAEMIEKLLALKGVTYEWNDHQTGTTRPEGMQYGFSAQNIRDVFPTLVEEDAQGYLQTAYGTYDAMMVEAIRYLHEENKLLKSELREIREMISEDRRGSVTKTTTRPADESHIQRNRKAGSTRT